jgi:hypothetical protein
VLSFIVPSVTRKTYFQVFGIETQLHSNLNNLHTLNFKSLHAARALFVLSFAYLYSNLSFAESPMSL